MLVIYVTHTFYQLLLSSLSKFETKIIICWTLWSLKQFKSEALREVQNVVDMKASSDGIVRSFLTPELWVAHYILGPCEPTVSSDDN